MLLLVMVVLTVSWAMVARATGWGFAYFMVLMHAGLMCMGAESMI